jgi:hypothetical protein|tara:strand:- start:112 stop:222 length:111 start_codon:yes stop_codon:yes gene_type:complete
VVKNLKKRQAEVEWVKERRKKEMEMRIKRRESKVAK